MRANIPPVRRDQGQHAMDAQIEGVLVKDEIVGFHANSLLSRDGLREHGQKGSQNQTEDHVGSRHCQRAETQHKR